MIDVSDINSNDDIISKKVIKYALAHPTFRVQNSNNFETIQMYIARMWSPEKIAKHKNEISELMAKKESLYLTNFLGETVLNIAVENSVFDLIKILLNQNADYCLGFDDFTENLKKITSSIMAARPESRNKLVSIFFEHSLSMPIEFKKTEKSRGFLTDLAYLAFEINHPLKSSYLTQEIIFEDFILKAQNSKSIEVTEECVYSWLSSVYTKTEQIKDLMLKIIDQGKNRNANLVTLGILNAYIK